MDFASIAARIFSAASQAPNQTAIPNNSGMVATANKLAETNNPLEQGALLRSLDNQTGGRTQTQDFLKGLIDIASKGGSAPDKASPTTTPQFDASDLYGPHGPRLSDIEQNSYGSCATLGTLGALANERPSLIRDAISYDAATQSFNVQLYDSSGNPQTVNVTQAEISANITGGGGGRRDNGVADAAIWPDVMEVARAKMVDTNHADGLAQGYADIAAFPNDAMRMLTGSPGTTLAFTQGSTETRTAALARMGSDIRTAIKSDQPVTLWVRPEGSTNGYSGTQQDGLVDDHVYTVTRSFQGSDGKWYVTLRNPWAQNNVEGKTRDSAFVTMSLDRLERLGGLQSFQIGD
jgi:hypothetical protein